MRVRLLREAGGLGDVLRAFSVATSIKNRHSGAEVWFYVLKDYAWHAKLCPAIDVVVPVDREERRDRDALPNATVHAYLKSNVAFDATVDLYCPAWKYERSNPKDVVFDRSTVFCREASSKIGIDLQPCVARMLRPEQSYERALTWLATHGLHAKFNRSRPLVGLQLRGTHPVRRLLDPRAGEVIEELKARDVDIVLFDMNVQPTRDMAERHGVHEATHLNNALLYGLVGEMDHMLTVDSGLYHLAAVLNTPATAVVGCTGGEYLSRSYPLASHVEPGEAEFEGLECDRPCYFTTCWRQRNTCKREGCIAMMRIGAKRIVDRVLESLAVVER